MQAIKNTKTRCARIKIFNTHKKGTENRSIHIYRRRKV